MQEERELLAREKAEKLAEKMRQQKAKDERRLQREKKGKKSKLKEWEMDYEFYIGEGLVSIAMNCRKNRAPGKTVHRRCFAVTFRVFFVK